MILANRKGSEELPKIGFGTWQLRGTLLKQALQKALAVGYRLFDTAAYYENEREIGLVFREIGFPREELIITSKLWNTDRGYDQTCKACNLSLKNLGLKYLDWYLIHWPANLKQFSQAEGLNQETWRALETLWEEGKVKNIGVSNFLSANLEAIFAIMKIKPQVNQIEIHPGFYPETTIEFCKKQQITLQAWSPLGKGKILGNELLTNLAAKYQVSTAQISLGWLVQQKIIPITKSTNPGHIYENFNLNFLLTENEIELIKRLPLEGFSGLNAEEVKF